MASKVLVKIPAVNFSSQVGKCSSDLGAIQGSSNINGTNRKAMSESSVSPITETPSNIIISDTCSDPHITQLEQNIRFLKEQHHIMLTSLHQEVESLRQRNRDLQFQLVFSRGSIGLVKSSPSSPEDDSKPQILLSPKQVNVTSLQVEILERDVAELRTSLSEARTRNAYLQNIVDEQQKKLESVAKASSLEDADPRSRSPDPDLTFKLEEAEKVIRRLRRENEEQRRELAMIKANQNKAQGGPTQHQQHHRGGSHWSQQHRENQGYHRREHHHDASTSSGSGHDPQQAREAAHTRFPPLSTHKYWHSNRRWNNSWDSTRGAGSVQQQQQQSPRVGHQHLPALAPGGCSSSSAPTGPAHFPMLNQTGTVASAGGGGRRGHRGSNFRGDRGGGPGVRGAGGRGQWDREGYRDQGYNQQT